jgi:WhiB family redox-sensing transcriptional regulator
MGDKIVNHETWMADAACRQDELAELFFHPDRERGGAKISRDSKAKAICNKCDVLDKCMDYVLKHKEPYGVWAGLSEDDRRHMGITLSVVV